MANGTPLTTNNGTNSNVYVYGAFVLKQGFLAGHDGAEIIGSDNNEIKVKAVVPNGEE